jgi:hypothetical protein
MKIVFSMTVDELSQMAKKNLHGWICKLLGCGHNEKRMVRFDYVVGHPKLKEIKHMPLEISITNEQQVNVSLKPVTATGKPAKLDGAPSWTVMSGNSSVKPADDGLSADLISSDDPGDTEVMVKADADLGSGVEEISDTIRLSVIGARAANLGLTAGEPTPKP